VSTLLNDLEKRSVNNLSTFLTTSALQRREFLHGERDSWRAILKEVQMIMTVHLYQKFIMNHNSDS